MGELATLIVILLFVAFLLRIDFIFYIVYVCVGVYLWNRFYTPYSLRHLRAERQFTERAFLGEPVAVTVKLYNDNRLAIPWLEFNESVAIELQRQAKMNRVLTLRGGQTAEFRYTVTSQRRGYYQLGPLRLKTSDLFGLLNDYTGYLAPDYLTIYPRITPLSQLGLPSRLPFGTIASRQQLFADPARPQGVRDFRTGDPLHQINWKVTAHSQKLMVKTFQPAISLETAVLLNLYQDDYHAHSRYETVEWAIELAASLAAHLIEQRQAVGLITNGVDPLLLHSSREKQQFDDVSGRLKWRGQLSSSQNPADFMPPPIAPRTGRGQLMKILEQLARLEAENSRPFLEWAPLTQAGLNWGVTLLTISPKGDEATCQMLHHFVRRGLNPVLIVTQPDYSFGQVQQRARQLGFRAYNVAYKRHLDAWRKARST
ncbi:MAG: DUF58 domain-containing protein [Chloroflexota bacterium]